MNPLAFLAPYRLGIEILAGVALLASLSIGVHHFLEHERDIGRNEVRAEYAQKLQEAKDAALKREKELIAQRDDAVAQGVNREALIQNLVAANSNATLRLRDTTTSISNSLSSLSADALRSVASAYGNVFTECQSKLSEMATTAERNNSEKKTLIDSWPKPK